MDCPCQSGERFETCCGPYLSGEKRPPSAEKLMRSRYSAFARANVDYIKKTLAPESRGDFDENAVRDWATKSDWQGLEIVRVEAGGPGDETGIVEFIARYSVNHQSFNHHEISEFRKDSAIGQWLFVDGKTVDDVGRVTIVREGPKIGRNDPCSCGSGKKYKKCCGA